MAPRVAKHPVGSALWVLDERLQAAQEVAQAAEEFAFSASNNMEWLNEHMAEVFSRNPLTMTEISKTPGKLRGRTPMTARKRNPLEERAPLTDVFASTPNAHASPSHHTQFYKQVSKFQVAEDKENIQAHPSPRPKISLATGKENADSGYHGMTDDETEPDTQEALPKIASPEKSGLMATAPQLPVQRIQSPPKPLQITRLEQQQSRRSETVDSFVSAKESPTSRPSVDEITSPPNRAVDNIEPAIKDSPFAMSIPGAMPEDEDLTESPEYVPEASQHDVEMQEELPQTVAPFEPPSPTRTESDDLSETSSPERPILRNKSSLTFATLPTRDTILPKKSMGARISRTSYAESSRPIQAHPKPVEPEQQLPRRRSSRQQSNVDLHTQQATEVEPEVDEITRSRQEISEASKEHSKTSTQRLHERITMLGKMNPHRPSKSVSATTSGSHNGTRDTIPNGDKFIAPAEIRNEDDDWIGPISTKAQEVAVAATTDAQRPSMFLQPKDASTFPEAEDDVFKAPSVEPTSKPTSFQHSKTTYPDLSALANASTTPAGSPVRTHTHADNPLSASKAKLFDMFKSARSIFASSAGTSAQARIQTPSHQVTQSKAAVESDNEDDMPPPVSQALEASNDTLMDLNVADAAPKTRRSSARVQQRIEQQTTNVDNHHQQIDVEERQAQAIAKVSTDAKSNEPKKATLATSQMSKHGELRRPGPKTATETQTKGRPAPVSIRVASQRVGQGAPSTATLGSTLHESLSQSTQQRQPPTLKTKGSNSSIKSGLTGTVGKSTTSAASRPKALEAAARKKEQDEREAQRKAELKREMEKRRAAKAEEERRVAQEQKDQRAAEQRALEAKQASQRQALEQRRVEALKKAEQQPARPQSSLAQHERPPSQSQTQAPRNDFRPLSKMSMHQDSARPPIPHINPAKPPKRYFQPEDEDQPERKFGQKSTGPVQQAANPAKRRRTSEIDEATEGSSRPAMATAPPMRLSTMQKSAPSNKFTPGYISAASSSSQAGPSSMLKTAMNGNYQAHHPKTPHDLTKYSSAKIPFGDASNQHGPQTAQRPQPGIFKTPGTANSKHGGAKSSPNFPEGDNISLPDICTDSEDEDSDDEGFVPPDWANSPALREILSQQQLLDPMKVFGPIGPLHMEELFKGNKERIIKFRKRTSSANWSGPDGLTEEERKKDVEARAKLVRDGGWTFNPSL